MCVSCHIGSFFYCTVLCCHLTYSTKYLILSENTHSLRFFETQPLAHIHSLHSALTFIGGRWIWWNGDVGSLLSKPDQVVVALTSDCARLRYRYDWATTLRRCHSRPPVAAAVAAARCRKKRFGASWQLRTQRTAFVVVQLTNGYQNTMYPANKTCEKNSKRNFTIAYISTPRCSHGLCTGI